MKADEMRAKLNQDYETVQRDWQDVQDAFAARLAAIGEAQQALAKLKAVDMYDRLYNDYVAIRHEWEQALGDLTNQLTTLAEVRRRHAETKDTIRIFEFSVTAAEAHKEGRINGSNAEKRKTQTVLFLAHLAAEDAEYKALLSAFENSRRRIDELEVEIEALKGKISYLRNLSRMNAGLAHALAG